jgi:LPXTG-motif cell wall-anchored protein
MRTKLLALIAGSAIALTAAMPAAAAPAVWDNDANSDFENRYHLGQGCTWDDLNENTSIEDWSEFEDNAGDELTIDTCILTDVYEESLDISHFERYVGGDGSVTGSFIDAPFCSPGWGIDLDTVESTTVEIDSRGDKVFVITGTYNGLDVVGELRMYAEMDLMRWHWTFTNNDNAAINNTNVELANGDTQDSYGDGTTSDGDQVWETTDWYGTMFNADDTVEDGERYAIATAFVGGNGEIAVYDVNENDVIDDGEQLELDYDFDVAAGESKELIWFLSSSDYTAGADPIASDSVDPLVAGFGDGVVQGRFARGLVDNNNSNWETINPEAADLADTGADTSSLWAGLGLLIAGVAVVAVRRRSRA